MDLELYSRFLIALVVVLALIGGVAWLARRLGLGSRLSATRGRTRRLAIVEVMALDARKRLVLVRRDDREHLLLLGPGHDLLVERDIATAPESFAAALDQAESAS